MKCVVCGGNTRITDTYVNKAGYKTRRRLCLVCGEKKSTVEIYVPDGTTARRIYKFIHGVGDRHEVMAEDIKAFVDWVLDFREETI